MFSAVPTAAELGEQRWQQRKDKHVDSINAIAKDSNSQMATSDPSQADTDLVPASWQELLAQKDKEGDTIQGKGVKVQMSDYDRECHVSMPQSAAGQRAPIHKRWRTWLVTAFLWGALAAFGIVFGLNAHKPSHGLQLAWMIIIGHAAVMYALYTWMWLASETFSFLRHVCDNNAAQSYLAEMRAARPIFTFHIVCYHYETHTHTDSKGNTTSQRVRVTTHRASMEYVYTQLEDDTPAMPFMGSDMPVCIHFQPQHDFFTDAARQAYSLAFEQFCNANRRDVHQETSDKMTMQGFKPRLLCVRDADHPPVIVSKLWYCLASIVGLAAVYMMVLDRHLGTHNQPIIKGIA